MQLTKCFLPLLFNTWTIMADFHQYYPNIYEEVFNTSKMKYWDIIHGDDIDSQSIAELLADWAHINSVPVVIKRVQRALGILDNGTIDDMLIKTINSYNHETLFLRLHATREAYICNIVKRDPSQKKHLQEWINHNNSFKFHG